MKPTREHLRAAASKDFHRHCRALRGIFDLVDRGAECAELFGGRLALQFIEIGDRDAGVGREIVELVANLQRPAHLLAPGGHDPCHRADGHPRSGELRDAGFIADMEKYLTAALDGWRVLRLAEPFITAPMVERIITLVRTAGVKSV